MHRQTRNSKFIKKKIQFIEYTRLINRANIRPAASWFYYLFHELDLNRKCWPYFITHARVKRKHAAVYILPSYSSRIYLFVWHCHVGYKMYVAQIQSTTPIIIIGFSLVFFISFLFSIFTHKWIQNATTARRSQGYNSLFDCSSRARFICAKKISPRI